MSDRPTASQRIYRNRSAQMRRAERRERLLAAALQLFGTRGYTATSIERLCAAAHVSPRNFYEEFTSREEVLAVLLDDINTRAAEALSASYDHADADLAIRLGRAVRAFVTVTADDPRWARIVFIESVGVSAELERKRLAGRGQWEDALLEMIGQAVERGETVDRDYRLTMIGVIGAVNNLVHHWSAYGQDIPLNDIIAELAHLLLAGLVREGKG